MEYSKKYSSTLTIYFKDAQCTVRHRENDLPAYVDNGYATAWFYEGKLHRTTGPAITYENDPSSCTYYIHGRAFSKEDWEKEVEKLEPMGQLITLDL